MQDDDMDDDDGGVVVVLATISFAIVIISVLAYLFR